MIRLPNNYAIDADGSQYILYKVYVAGPDAKKPKTPGEEYTVPVGYWPTLSKLFQASIQRLQREAVASGDITTLQEAAAVFRRIEADVRALVFPGEGEPDQ